MSGKAPRPITVRSARVLSGSLEPIGDKSLTHRALLLAGIARGRSRLTRPNPGQDCNATARAVEQLGALLRPSAGGWEIEGAGGRLRDPEHLLDLGNSGTGIRLLAGLVAGQGLFAVLSGDASLRRRPMRRIAEPLEAMGATVLLRSGEYPPIAVRGGRIVPGRHRLPVASAQVKSAILLAALGLQEGEVVVEEPGPSRDHTERFLEWLGISLAREPRRVTLRAPAPIPKGFDLRIPADPSAASFFAVAASLVEGSEVVLESVDLNPTRTGALEVLQEMGGSIEIEPEGSSRPEPIGTIRVRSSALRGTVVGGERLVRAIDEVPVLAVAAMAAQGETLFRDARELRVKESDRIASTAALVRALGGEVETGSDWMRIAGTGGIAGGEVEVHGDHRIAMSAIVAGCAARAAVKVDDISAVATSDPTFLDSIARIGADLE